MIIEALLTLYEPNQSQGLNRALDQESNLRLLSPWVNTLTIEQTIKDKIPFIRVLFCFFEEIVLTPAQGFFFLKPVLVLEPLLMLRAL